MSKSPLRRLAADYADGRIAPGEYRARRRELIDAVTAGASSIEREPPPGVAPGPSRIAAPAPTSAGVPWQLLLAGASALCLLLLAWLLWPAAPAPTPPAPLPPVPVAEVPRSRALVERFLALRDFSTPAIERLEAEWEALDAGERAQARDALWFGALVRALRDEVKTHKALAGLAGGDAALERARRVLALGTRLGVAEQLPALEDVPPAVAPALAAPDPASPPPGPARHAADRGAAADTQPPLTGRQWLAARHADQLTLQIFAVNSLDRVEQLMASHPELELHVLATDGAAPRYRVFHGVFSDESAARAAFHALPASVSDAAGGAMVKSFSAVREDLGQHADTTPAPAPAAAGPVAREDYTLQLLASASRASAQSLVDAFPALALELRSAPGDPAPYRVIYGRFPSPDDARRAAQALPATLLSRVGAPIAKAVAETGSGAR